MDKANEANKVTWKGYLSLFVLIVLFSGVFKDADNFLKAFDFANLTGSFGQIVDGVDFTGKGGTGAKDGFLFALTLVPTVALAVGIIDVVESMGAMKAAAKIFNPILRPLLGIPGTAGVAFVSSFTSSDVASIMTKELVESGDMTDDERTIFVAYQYAGSAVILNTINTQAPLLPIALMAVGPIILIEIFCKLLGANMIRLYINMKNKKQRSVA
ncbi:nucleoside recognition domain-containing protein [Metaclostridioides mangenotii]|jgi:nucleoside recognition membrane protein YjiH|uniref:Nucleoside recognition membrane protein YjiH n=1 Tax=Metaclostridioides mangenotii TaxID=1540 RepID=A0ABS4E801_9FIRM|nr:nucleoside recognition domain-containing protein [Clostridioides mangenotii]MBP1854071.1 nucleoside recognition membrane protein YjiH [Clostridioides mangenotii]